MKTVDRLRQNCLRWTGFLLLLVCARGEIKGVGSYTVASSMLIVGGLCITNGMAYVPSLNGELLMVDVNDPGKTALKGRFETAGSAYSVYIAGTLAYVAEGDKGFQIIDISDPSKPLLKGSYGACHAMSLQVVGARAYAAGGKGIQIVDVSDPGKPLIKGSYAGSAWSLQVVGDLVYAADCEGLNGLQIIDIAVPDKPLLKGSYAGGAGSLQVVGNLAYMAGWDNGHCGLLIKQVNPRLCRGDSQSLTIPGVF